MKSPQLTATTLEPDRGSDDDVVLLNLDPTDCSSGKEHWLTGNSTAAKGLWLALGLASGMAAILYLCIWGTKFGLDLQVYRDGTKAWIDGADPYLQRYTGAHLAYTYPPFALLGLGWLDLLDFRASLFLWWFVSLAALWGSLFIFGRRQGRRGGHRWGFICLVLAFGSVLLLEPVRSTFDFGQVNLVLMFLVVVDTMSLSDSCWHRGVLVGVAGAIKLVPLVFILYFVVQRDLKSVARSVLTFGALQGASWLISPSASVRYWFHVLWEPGRIGSIAYPGNQSWYAVLHRPPFIGHGWLSVAAWFVLVACTSFLAISISYRSIAAGRRDAAVISLALCGLLISPISWSHHWVWVVLIPIVFVVGVHRPSLVVRWTLAALLAITVVAPYWWGLHGWAGTLAKDSLVVVTFALLVAWWIDTRSAKMDRPRTKVSDRVVHLLTTGHVAAVQRPLVLDEVNKCPGALTSSCEARR